MKIVKFNCELIMYQDGRIQTCNGEGNTSNESILDAYDRCPYGFIKYIKEAQVTRVELSTEKVSFLNDEQLENFLRYNR